MRNQINKKSFYPIRSMIVVGIFCLSNTLSTRAQVVSLNAVYISNSTGTVVKSDTLRINSSSSFANSGTLTQANIVNDGTLLGSGTYNITNLFTNSGTFSANTSTVNFNGSGSQTIPGLTYYNITASDGNTKTAGGTINIINELTVGPNTTLALGSNNIRLKSDSTYTARLTSFPATAAITYGSGRFIAERYVKGRRKYRLITSPVTSSSNASLTSGEEALSIWGNWQNQGNNSTPNVGTFITGGSAADGFDTQTSNASIFTYNAASRIFTGFTTANGKNTKYTPLKAGLAYYLFVYGDRTNSAYTSNPNKTILSSTGMLLTGDQTYTTSSTIPLTATTNGFTMLGNPYASAIDWAGFSRTNISNTYWGWDPNLNSTGGYVTVSTAGSTTLISPYSGSVGLNQYIQSGQGFFVKTTGASPSLTIHETDKVSDFNGLAFRNQANNIPLIAINLLYDDASGTTLMDGALAAFDNGFSNTIGNEDASKILNSTEVLAIRNQAELLSIDARKMPLGGDTISIHTTSLHKNQYRLQVFANQLDNSVLEPYLVDSYTNNIRLLSLRDTNYIPFSVDPNNTASVKTNRFYIVFRNPGQASQEITQITAEKQNGLVNVKWNVSNESSVLKYEVEKAAGGSIFSYAGEQAPTGSSAYDWIDFSPVSGINQYRIRIRHVDGTTSYSKTVSVNMGDLKPTIRIYPNPVTDKTIQVLLMQLETGTYTAQLFDAKGQLVFRQGLIHEGGITTQRLSLNSSLPAGTYFFRLLNANSKFNQTIIIQ